MRTPPGLYKVNVTDYSNSCLYTLSDQIGNLVVGKCFKENEYDKIYVVKKLEEISCLQNI